jgi:hypothetical protein
MVLTQQPEARRPVLHEGFFIAIIFLFFISLVTWFFASTPGLGTQITAFIQSFRLVQAPNTSLEFPAPPAPAFYSTIYAAAAQWCLIWGIFEVFILILRFGIRSRARRIVETFTHIIWWFGAYYLITIFLTPATTVTLWFAFWGALFVLLGGELLLRGLILAALSRLK